MLVFDMKSSKKTVKAASETAPKPVPEFSIRALVPSDTPEYMLSAWASCMTWAIAHAEIMAAFRADTGNQWQPGRTPLDKMIDNATGAHQKFITDFVNWANINVWGTIDGCVGDED